MIKNTRKPKSTTTKTEPKLATIKPEPIKTAPAPKPATAAPVAKAPTPAPAIISKPAPVPAPAAIKAEVPAKVEMPRQNHVSLDLLRPEAKQVFVAGSFNNWRPESNPLSRHGNGHWTGEFNFKPGRYEYLFVVDGQWLPDPNAKEAVQNPFGGKNSVLLVSE